jgi:hypothetical protein
MSEHIREKPINIWLPDETHRKFKAMTKGAGTSMDQVINNLVSNWIKEHEGLYGIFHKSLTQIREDLKD